MLIIIFIGSVVMSFLVVPVYRPFLMYMSVLSFFHLSEFVTIAIIKPRSLNVDSFLLNHSPEYHIAAITSWIEFFVELYFFPSMKQMSLISLSGVLLCITGEVIRKSAMLTAGSNFSHTVEYRKERGHRLVTSGLYGVWRHPSYTGWFLWSLGTQIVLINPICLIGYAVVSRDFFRHRIHDEEQILIEFFGEEYIEYRKQVPCGVPFISE